MLGIQKIHLAAIRATTATPGSRVAVRPPLFALAHEVARGFAGDGTGQTPSNKGGRMYIGVGTLVFIVVVLLIVYLVRRV